MENDVSLTTSSGTADAPAAPSQAAPSQEALSEDQLCRTYASRIRGYGLRHLRDSALAEDLVQHVLLVVLQALRGCRTCPSPRTT